MLDYIITDAGARVAVVGGQYLPQLAELDAECPLALDLIVVCGAHQRVPDLSCRVIAAGDGLAVGPARREVKRLPRRRDVGCIIYTSGTTGASKGVKMTWAQLAATMPAEWTSGAGRDEAVYLPFPMHHLGGRTSVCQAARLGGRVVVRSSFSVGAFWHDIRQYECTFTFLPGGVASYLYHQARDVSDQDNPLRKVIMAPVPSYFEDFSARFGVEVVTAYNMTEISSPIYAPNGIQDWRSCGRLRSGYPHYEARLVDEDDEEVALGSTGELVVRTGAPWTLNAGYHGKPEATLRAWRNGWFHTGDIFRCDDAGNFYFVDRQKDALRVRGENVSSLELEEIANGHPRISQCAAVGVPASTGEQDILLLVAAAPEVQIDAPSLVAYFRHCMPKFMVPRYVQVVSGLPTTDATHRVRKEVLRQQLPRGVCWDSLRCRAVDLGEGWDLQEGEGENPESKV
jgi:crotonobetaine/carnitine-CoA ligase